MKVFLITLIIFVVLDTLLFFVFPFNGIELNPEYQCSFETEGFSALGCATRGGSHGITKLPSFLVASHEYTHMLRADEPLAFSYTIIVTIIFSVFSVDASVILLKEAEKE